MIEISHLCFSYTQAPFLTDLNLQVEAGEIFGFLGPSGAGKSTLQKVLTGLLPGYTGRVVVNGTDMRQCTDRFYENIGVDFEYPCLYEKLTARENLRFFASLYQGPTESPDELLRAVGLLADADKRVGTFSKGMKSRLGFVRALLHRPVLLFLDEPTSGLDPSCARVMKDMILQQKARGVTVVLTTHNMADAAELCDRVAFLADGVLRAVGTPQALTLQNGAGRLRYTYLENGVEQQGECPLCATGADARLQSLLAENRLRTIHSCEPDLGDIFCQVTGRHLT